MRGQQRRLTTLFHSERSAAFTELSAEKMKRRKFWRNCNSCARNGTPPAYSLALIALGLDDKTEALHWLEESYRERDGDSIGVIRVDPLLRSLRGDPRFEALAEKIAPRELFK